MITSILLRAGVAGVQIPIICQNTLLDDGGNILKLGKNSNASGWNRQDRKPLY